MVPGFDPNAPAARESGLFGLDSGPEAATHVLAIPFEATTSYRRGTSKGPAAILAASRQVDLFDLETGRPYEAGIWMPPVDERVVAWNAEACGLARDVIDGGGELDGDPRLEEAVERVTAIQGELNDWLYAQAAAALASGKLVGVLGGDHSVPFGSIRAHAERHPGMGILHVDAHADLRVAYEGFEWSHASILHNVASRLDDVGTIVQVGIRDLCEEEHVAIRDSGGRIRTLFDHEWADARLRGRDLVALARRTIAPLPAEVYVTFDVDGLDPSSCPSTGTPVPGGLSWSEAMCLLAELVASGRRIVGFDLTEVAPEPGREPGQGRDEIVGARLLYRLIGFARKSRG